MEVNDQREKDVNDMHEKEGKEDTRTHIFEMRSNAPKNPKKLLTRGYLRDYLLAIPECTRYTCP